MKEGAHTSRSNNIVGGYLVSKAVWPLEPARQLKDESLRQSLKEANFFECIGSKRKWFSASFVGLL